MATKITEEQMHNMTSEERKAYAIEKINASSNFVLISLEKLNDKENSLTAFSNLNCSPQTLMKFVEIMKEMGDDLQVQLLSGFNETLKKLKEKRNPMLSGKTEDVN